MLFQIVVVICLASGPCDQEHNLAIMRVPEPATSIALCGLAGQAFAAQTALVGADDRVRVFCTARAAEPLTAAEK